MQSFSITSIDDSSQIKADHDTFAQEELASRKRQLSSEQQPVPSKHFKPSSVITEFLDVKYQLQHVLQSCDAKAMFEECENLMASEANGTILFTSEYFEQLKDCPTLLQKLNPYFNWINHSILSAAINACDNPVATNLLEQFDSRVDKSLPITDYPVPQPSPNMVPYDNSTHTVLAAKLNAELNSLSLQNYFDLCHMLQEKLQVTSHAFQLLAAKRSSTFIYWMIPKCVVSVITEKIPQQSSDLYQSDIVELSVYPDSVFTISSSLKVGSLCFLTQINHLVRSVYSICICIIFLLFYSH